MLDFRPHTIQVATIVSGGGFDENGMPIPDVGTWESIPCRIEPNGTGNKVVYIDGIATNYSFTVYLDQDCREFQKGEKVKLVGLDGEVGNDKQFEVLGFFRFQLNARLWV